MENDEDDNQKRAGAVGPTSPNENECKCGVDWGACLRAGYNCKYVQSGRKKGRTQYVITIRGITNTFYKSRRRAPTVGRHARYYTERNELHE